MNKLKTIYLNTKISSLFVVIEQLILEFVIVFNKNDFGLFILGKMSIAYCH